MQSLPRLRYEVHDTSRGCARITQAAALDAGKDPFVGATRRTWVRNVRDWRAPGGGAGKHRSGEYGAWNTRGDMNLVQSWDSASIAADIHVPGRIPRIKISIVEVTLV